MLLKSVKRISFALFKNITDFYILYNYTIKNKQKCYQKNSCLYEYVRLTTIQIFIGTDNNSESALVIL